MITPAHIQDTCAMPYTGKTESWPADEVAVMAQWTCCKETDCTPQLVKPQAVTEREASFSPKDHRCHLIRNVLQVSLSTDAVLRDKVNKRVQDLEQEVKTLSRLQHPNIVRYYVSSRPLLLCCIIGCLQGAALAMAMPSSLYVTLQFLHRRCSSDASAEHPSMLLWSESQVMLAH